MNSHGAYRLQERSAELFISCGEQGQLAVLYNMSKSLCQQVAADIVTLAYFEERRPLAEMRVLRVLLNFDVGSGRKRRWETWRA